MAEFSVPNSQVQGYKTYLQRVGELRCSDGDCRAFLTTTMTRKQRILEFVLAIFLVTSISAKVGSIGLPRGSHRTSVLRFSDQMYPRDNCRSTTYDDITKLMLVYLDWIDGIGSPGRCWQRRASYTYMNFRQDLTKTACSLGSLGIQINTITISWFMSIFLPARSALPTLARLSCFSCRYIYLGKWTGFGREQTGRCDKFLPFLLMILLSDKCRRRQMTVQCCRWRTFGLMLGWQHRIIPLMSF